MARNSMVVFTVPVNVNVVSEAPTAVIGAFAWHYINFARCMHRDLPTLCDRTLTVISHLQVAIVPYQMQHS